MRKKRAKAIKELAFDAYNNNAEQYANHGNVYRMFKRAFTRSRTRKAVVFNSFKVLASKEGRSLLDMV